MSGSGPVLLKLERSTWRIDDNARTVLFVMDTSGPLSATCAAGKALGLVLVSLAPSPAKTNENTFLVGSPAVQSTREAARSPPAGVIEAGLVPGAVLPPSARKFPADVTRLRCSSPEPTNPNTGRSGLVAIRLAPLSTDSMLNWSLVVSSSASVIATNGPPSASRAPFRTDAIPLSL